ncbi:hypothetical protein MMC27_004052 [Xylographa pallens]|nr:hypothetical protein [Xylographa pallens]
MAAPVTDQIAKLEAARHLVLSDSTHYAAIVPGILPIIGAQSHLEIRRWGADFLAEAFASPALSLQGKESLSVQVLQTLKELLELPNEDTGVLKSVIQAAASIYGLFFRYIINNPLDSQTWERMASIKSNILKRWDSAATGVRICCIKFVQRVVQVQTPGIIADPRVGAILPCLTPTLDTLTCSKQRPEQNEVSLALVPRDHPLIPPPNLEAEASGLLDRLLNVFYEGSSDAVLINATLNCLSILVRTRGSIANKIVSTVLSFNPLKLANTPMSPKSKVHIKSMERTTRAFLMNIYRRNENGPFAARIKQHVDRLTQSRMDIFDEGSRKRGAPVEPTDGLDDAKRRRLGAEVNTQKAIPPLPPGPTSIAQLYTLTSEEGLRSFDVTQLPIDLVVRIALPVLQRIDQGLLSEAVNGVRSRYIALGKSQQTQTHGSTSLPVSSALDEEEDDYEPDFEPTEDSEQILNKEDGLSALEVRQEPKDLALGPFKLPQPPPLTSEEAERLGKGTISRVFSMMSVLEEPTKAPKPGLHRLAGSNYDKEAWITVITRLATRASSGLQDAEDEVKNEAEQNGIIATHKGHSLADGIRETLWKYIIDDFRIRIPIAIAWLNEEWYNDRVIEMQSASSNEQNGGSMSHPQNYEKWVLRVLDGIVPYLDAKDKVLIRFLSEIPGVSEAVLERIKNIARDPDRVTLAVNAIHYLVLLRPPVREMCLDSLEDMWRNYDDARAPTRKLLAKWRPHVLEADTANTIKPDVKQILMNTAPTPPGEQSAPAKQEIAPSAIAAAS